VFGGSGTAVMSYEAVQKEIMQMTGKLPSDIFVLYLGTASYDATQPMIYQTSHFTSAGATVFHLKVAVTEPTPEEVQKSFGCADVVLVSGGNTLYAVDRWKKFGIHDAIHGAMTRGAILAGGSAGAICWFDGGHSDSMDPTTYLKKSQPETTTWEYIRVDGLRLLPGLVCPHHDRTQSNGVKRSDDFDSMLRRHKGERGICIDHFALLIIDGESYQVESFAEGAGVYVKDVAEDGYTIVKITLPPLGKVSEILKPASEIVQDPRVEVCRQENKS